MNYRVNSQTRLIDLGLIDYAEAWRYQSNLFEEILTIKKSNRDLPEASQQITPNFLIFCEHPHVFTLGKSGDEKNLLIPKEKLDSINATYYHINRGGDITYHGPGQLVVYPVIDMENFFTDIHKYMRSLEEAVILTLNELGLTAGRIPGLTGVWLNFSDEKKAGKICALGVKTSRWVTLHGLAFNINTQLDYFKYIVPCGIEDKSVTSLEKELGAKQDMAFIKSILLEKIASVFKMEIVN